jgi:hypothetical protein
VTDIVVTQGQLDALVEALASGARSVSYQGRTVQYGTFAEMRAAINWLQSRLAGSTAPTSVVYLRRGREC